MIIDEKNKQSEERKKEVGQLQEMIKVMGASMEGKDRRIGQLLGFINQKEHLVNIMQRNNKHETNTSFNCNNINSNTIATINNQQPM